MEYLWGLSQKTDGQMKIYSDDDGVSLSNRQKFFEKLGLNFTQAVQAGLIHGNNIKIVDQKDLEQKIIGVDGLVTSIPEIILTLTVADCLPVYFLDQEKKVIGLAHAGWRGVVQNIVAKMVEKMTTEFGSKPAEIKIKIGPHIQSCHFEIKDDVAEQFAQYEDFIDRSNNKIKLNLSAVVGEQLKAAGVKPENIEISNDCTYCLDKKYYSFRRDRPEKVEAMIAYISQKI